MLRQAINTSKSKIDAYADLASDYLRLRMDYATMQEPTLTLGESDKSKNLQVMFEYFLKRAKKERELQECAKKLTEAFNNAVLVFCEGLRDEHLADYNTEIIDNLLAIFVRFNRMANIDVFKGILYIEDVNKSILIGISEKLATYTDNIQFMQLKDQIDALLRLNKAENSVTEEENLIHHE